MRTSFRTAAALTAVVAAVTTGVTTATADTHTGRADDGGYGYTKVRKGVPDSAAHFKVTSPDVRNGGAFPADAYADSFGCSGANQQIRLSWHGAPKDTRSYAVTMFDPDAPTGSGFWHWLTWDIPATSTELGSALPTGAVAGTNDAGQTGYTGPCPPSGDITHHYRITVYALDTAGLQLPAATPAAVTRFTMSTHVIGTATITATARRS
ncbi:YbhB/YbcL family Raf kinase inhibitor-like protein [Streptomyces sp. NPDC001980]|uniref:YbhB/YbcL family Raf kinase inhibitor-like protein n=1 Tax=Streptomyces sp. NPDC001980 TaxID=3157126 RepID=UPI003323500A